MINKNMSTHQAKDTGMALVLVCLILFLFNHQLIWINAALFFLLGCMVCPRLYRPAAHVWFRFSHFMGGIVSTILLTIIFYTLLTPIGLLRKLAGADALKLKKWGTTESAFTQRGITFSAADLEKPY